MLFLFIFIHFVRNQYLIDQQQKNSTKLEMHKKRLMENSLQNLKQYVEMFAGKLKIIRTCLQIKSCIGHNLLKTSIALAVVLQE